MNKKRPRQSFKPSLLFPHLLRRISSVVSVPLQKKVATCFSVRFAPIGSKCVGLSPSLGSSTPFVCAFCMKSVCLQLRDLQSEVAQVKDVICLENSFNCSISPPVKTKFDSLHESLCDISSKLDLFSLPLSQAAPNPPSADPQSPQSRVASNFFFIGTVHPKNPRCHCPPLLSTPILFNHHDYCFPS